MQGPPDDGPAGPPEAAKARASAATPTAQPHLKAGARLRAAREELGLSLKQISDDLRIKTDYLQALESMNVNLIPGKAFARAYLRDYAKRLGLPAPDLMAQYENECARLREDADEQIRNPRSKPGRERPWLWAVALALVAAGFVGLRAMQDRDGEEVVAAAPPPVAADVPVAPQAPAADTAADDPWARRVVELRATAPAWLEVRGSDGTIFASRTMQAGEIYRPDVGAGWTLHARDGGSFEVLVNGQSVGLLGDTGAPVLGRQVDRIEPPAQPLTAAAG